MVSRISNNRVRFLGLMAALTLGVAACGGGGTDTTTPAGTEPAGTEPAGTEASGSSASGSVQIDGSSTVFPISEAMAEEFMVANPDAKVTVGVSGTGGGFKRFCSGETDISNASRPIKTEEMEICATAGIEFIEVPVAYDGLSVVVHPSNNWATCMTPEELAKTWAPTAEGKITNWKQINDTYPDKPLDLFGPGTDSGTYDYFVEATVDAVLEEEGTRGDFTASEDDNVIVQGVTSDEAGMGFFGYAYYEENKDSLKIVPIKNANGDCVEPTPETIADGTYNPLSRPIFFYVKKTSYEENPAVKGFVDYHLDPANSGLITEAGYVALPDMTMGKVLDRVTAMTVGSIFEGGSSVGVKLDDKL
ncbi:phosphate-binding protein [Prochlorothrix hollandica PCC 9006 = CALU 1027]|uniref:Phosphate-binding protein n=2 Tax=Prochlorothrix hollandica TaxID=1223 RepID=A0A0M2PY11_PROHO|nr:phosphate-binding protein [Prochlorothrix hollandica PCC 9006 = CALU 1027]